MHLEMQAFEMWYGFSHTPCSREYSLYIGVRSRRLLSDLIAACKVRDSDQLRLHLYARVFRDEQEILRASPEKVSEIAERLEIFLGSVRGMSQILLS